MPRISDDVRREVISQLYGGYKHKDIAEDFGLKRTSVSSIWAQEKRRLELGARTVLPIKDNTVANIRKVLQMLDDGTGPVEVARVCGLSRQTIRRWRDMPKYREATYEYNDDFHYDADDPTDCSVVAHHLCTMISDVSERMEMMLAGAGISVFVQDDNSTDFKPVHNSRANRKRAE